MLAPEELAALSAAAKRAGISTNRLAQILIVHGLARLERGDRDIERAVKGSRDAAVS